MKKSIFIILLAVILTVSLTGCRKRISIMQAAPDLPYQYPPQESEPEQKNENQEIEEEEDKKDKEQKQEPTKTNAWQDNRTPEIVELPVEAARQANTGHDLDSDDIASISADIIADNSITIIELNDEVSGQTTTDNDEGGAIGLIIDQHTELLKQGVGSLYPCDMGNVYFEKTEDFLTVENGSQEHILIKEAGGLNVAEMLRPTALKVHEDWVIRKNPDSIVKCVSGEVLGHNVHDIMPAVKAYTDFCSRQGWETIIAVANKNVILLSEELFFTEEGRLAAKLYIASAMYPTLFSNIDLNEYCRRIFGEDSGIYVYTADT